jgi:hypothetical protein
MVASIPRSAYELKPIIATSDSNKSRGAAAASDKAGGSVVVRKSELQVLINLLYIVSINIRIGLRASDILSE